MQKATMIAQNSDRHKPKSFIAVWLGSVLVAATMSAGAVQSVNLVWGPSTSPGVAGYNIYYGGANGIYTNMVTAGNVTNVTITGLLDGTTYYFAAKAINKSGVESGFSNQTSYVVPTAAAWLGAGVRGSSGFSFPVNGVGGYRYIVEASTNMVNWTPLETNTAPFSFSDPSAGQFSHRFYRTVYFP